MNYYEKVEAHVSDLNRQGINKYVSAPLPFRILWALHLNVPPPFFLPFLANLIISGTFIGMCLVFLLWGWWAPHMSVWHWVLLILGSLVAGVPSALYYRRKSRTLNLPSWQNYNPAPS